MRVRLLPDAALVPVDGGRIVLRVPSEAAEQDAGK
jgi:hypothetical protein